jgi:uncharacterized protein YqfA (UPF0365 family)
MKFWIVCQAPTANLNMTLAIAALVFVLVLFLVLLAVLVPFFKLWFQAFLSGRPISVAQLLGMRLRKVDAKQVVRCGIMAAQSGHPIEWKELERSYLTGVDLEKITLAYIESCKTDKDFSLEELVDADRQSRLSQLLQ